MSEMVERAARAVCANSPGGFCRDIGGDLGCKNGRGVAPHWSNCIASADQLGLCGHASTARAVIKAMREPTDAMVDVGWIADQCATSVYIVGTYQAMIDSALKTPAPTLDEVAA